MSGIHDDGVLALRALDLGSLVALDRVLRTRHVTRAAAELGVTQSAMSHTLRRLRAHFGDPLLVRVGGGLEPTPRAQALQRPLRVALVALGQALDAGEPFDPATSARVFRVATPDLFDAVLLPRLIAHLTREAPGVSLTVRGIDAGAHPRDRLVDGDLDLALVPIIDGPQPEGHADMLRRTLFRDHFCCFVREGHPALRDGVLALSDFAAASHVLISPEGRGPGLVDRRLAEHGLERHIALRLPTFAAAPRVVATTDLVLTAPASLAPLVADLPVVPVDAPVLLPGHALALLWHRRLDADPGHRWLREVIGEVGVPRG